MRSLASYLQMPVAPRRTSSATWNVNYQFMFASWVLIRWRARRNKGPRTHEPGCSRSEFVSLPPTTMTDIAAVERVSLFWKALGCNVKRLTPEEHDLALATTSHLPHFVAALLAGQLPEKWRDFTATGFRDTTRIAVGDPTLWTAIAIENSLAISHAIDQFAERLGVLSEALLKSDGETLNHLLTEGKKVRDALGS